MSCDRIDPKDFHGPAAQQYTLNCLEELTRSPKFRSYVRHVEYKERLYLVWFLAPFTLFGILYYHLALFGSEGVSLFMEPSARSELALSEAPVSMVAITAVLLLYAIPCIVLAPFVGFFEEPSLLSNIAVLLFISSVNVAVVAYGGPRLHHPPFLTTSPTLTEIVTSWKTVDVTVVFLRDILVRRALCLEGYALAGYAVAPWFLGPRVAPAVAAAVDSTKRRLCRRGLVGSGAQGHPTLLRCAGQRHVGGPGIALVVGAVRPRWHRKPLRNRGKGSWTAAATGRAATVAAPRASFTFSERLFLCVTLPRGFLRGIGTLAAAAREAGARLHR